jgi:hypothetical protein
VQDRDDRESIRAGKKRSRSVVNVATPDGTILARNADYYGNSNPAPSRYWWRSGCKCMAERMRRARPLAVVAALSYDEAAWHDGIADRGFCNMAVK